MSGGWTTGDKVGLGLNVGSALFGALGANKAQKSNDRTAAAQQVLAALRNRAATLQEQQGMRQRQAEQFASMSPLGGEQQYIQRQKMLQAILPQLGKNQIRPTDPGVAAATPDVGGLGRILGSNPSLAATFSNDAIQRAITDRRNALTNVDPTVRFQHLGDYGFENNGFSDETEGYRQDALGRRSAAEDQLMQMADEELAKARSMEQQAAQQSKGTPWWKKVLGVAAGVGSAFIPGGPAWLAPLIGAGTGAISGGLEGAILGGAAGYGTEALQGKTLNPFAQRQSGSGFNNSMTEASLPAGMFGQNRQPLQLQGNGFDLTEAITGVGMDRPEYRRPANTARGNMAAERVSPFQAPKTPLVMHPNPMPGGGGMDAAMSSNPWYMRLMNGANDYLEEIGMPFASTPDGPDTPFGRAMQSPIGSLMTGGVAGLGRGAAQQGAQRMAPSPMGGATSGTNPLAGWKPGNPNAVQLPRPNSNGPMYGPWSGPMQGTASSESQVARLLQLLRDPELQGNKAALADALANPVSQSAIRALPQAGGGVPSNVAPLVERLRAILSGAQ